MNLGSGDTGGRLWPAARWSGPPFSLRPGSVADNSALYTALRAALQCGKRGEGETRFCMKRAFVFPGQGTQAVGMGASRRDIRAGAPCSRRSTTPCRKTCRHSCSKGRKRPYPDRERPAGVDGASLRSCACSASRGHRARRARSRSSRAIRSANIRRSRPQGFLHRGTARLLRSRPGDAGGGAGRRRARWRRCSAPTSKRRGGCAEAAGGGRGLRRWPTTMRRARW